MYAVETKWHHGWSITISRSNSVGHNDQPIDPIDRVMMATLQIHLRQVGLQLDCHSPSLAIRRRVQPRSDGHQRHAPLALDVVDQARSHPRSDGRDGHPPALSRDGRAGVAQSQYDVDGLFVFDNLGMAIGKVSRVFVNRPVAAGDVDKGEDALVSDVVKVDGPPLYPLVLPAQVQFVEDGRVQKVDAQDAHREVRRKRRLDGERYGHDEGHEQVEQRLVDLLKDEQLGANLPPAEFPRSEDIVHVVPQSADKEKVPSTEPLLEHGHLAEPAARPSRAREQRIGRLGLDKHARAHGDPAPELSGSVSKEPVLRDGVAWMLMECADQKLGVPDANGSVRKRGGPDLACKVPLYPAQFVFEVLSLLTERPLGRLGSDQLDRVTDTLDHVGHSIADDGEIRWQRAVVVDEQDVFEPPGCVASDGLGDNLAAHRRPHMVDAVLFTYGLGVVHGVGLLPLAST